ncbi:hypothetical protein [Mycobacterium sp. MMS18-G62]
MIAYTAMIVGPGIVGSAISSADGLFGIDVFDIFCHNKKKCDKHDRGLDIPQARSNQVAGINMVPQGVAGNGAGGAPDNSATTARPSTLPAVPTAPSARSVVIRTEPGASAPAAMAPVPVVVPPVTAVPLVAPVPAPEGLPPAAGPAPAAPVAPVIPQPPAGQLGIQPLPTVAVNAPAAPAMFRVGYPDVLRTADIEALIIATVPGISGMAALTAAGALLGYRQAKAAQVVRATAIARFMR